MRVLTVMVKLLQAIVRATLKPQYSVSEKCVVGRCHPYDGTLRPGSLNNVYEVRIDKFLALFSRRHLPVGSPMATPTLMRKAFHSILVELSSTEDVRPYAGA